MSEIIQNPTKRAITTLNHLQHEFSESFSPDSHDLAQLDYEVKGEAQKQPEVEVRDLGWRKNLSDMPATLIGGISNEDLFARIRRFNKDVFDVRAVPLRKNPGLDLTEAWNDDHATDKLTLNLQRFYLSIVLGLANLGKHISRLRSWKETRRTATFCITYFAAWYLNLLVPLLLGTLLVLVGSERARLILFPPAPLPLVNISTGGLQKPRAGQLGTVDTLTGAPEKAAGEAKEEEAANFVDNIQHIIARAVGMHENGDEGGDPLEGKVPKPIRNMIKSVKEASSAPGHATDEAGKDMTQKPMEELLWNGLKPRVIDPVVKTAPHAIGEIVDNWERFANAISPTAPFSRLAFLRIQGVLAPLFFVSLFMQQHFVYKASSFSIGFAIFGEPIISKSLKFVNEKFPHWMKVLEPKNNILRGVPTNSQITLTLLRIGEAHHSPIPPVPDTKSTDANDLPQVRIDQVPLVASDYEVRQAMETTPTPETHGGQSSSPNDADGEKNGGDEKDEKPKHRHLSRFIGFIKGNTKVVVETKLAVDHVYAAAGSRKAQGHLGILPEDKNLIYAGPAEFKARLNGKRGWLYISNPSTPTATNATSPEPRLLFIADANEGKLDLTDESKIQWSIVLTNIRRLKRATASANKIAEKAAEWSEGRELLGSLEIIDHDEREWRFTAIPERDELFNRLIAVGKQKWENM